MEGIFNDDGTFVLEPKAWIVQPPFYGMMGMTGKINEELNMLTGKIELPNCKSFRLSKIITE